MRTDYSSYRSLLHTLHIILFNKTFLCRPVSTEAWQAKPAYIPILHRKDTKTIYMRNNTQLPVKWKITGWENLGEDFTLAEDNGVVEPLSEVPLHAYFRAMKPVSTIKKMIRLEVSIGRPYPLLSDSYRQFRLSAPASAAVSWLI